MRLDLLRSAGRRVFNTIWEDGDVYTADVKVDDLCTLVFRQLFPPAQSSGLINGKSESAKFGFEYDRSRVCSFQPTPYTSSLYILIIISVFLVYLYTHCMGIKVSNLLKPNSINNRFNTCIYISTPAERTSLILLLHSLFLLNVSALEKHIN
jgi:hypothetical protein